MWQHIMRSLNVTVLINVAQRVAMQNFSPRWPYTVFINAGLEQLEEVASSDENDGGDEMELTICP